VARRVGEVEQKGENRRKTMKNIKPYKITNFG